MQKYGLVSALTCALALGPTAAQADFPDHPVHWIVGFSPGGGADAMARLVGQRLSQKWGQQVIIDNRPGADGVIAGEVVAKSAPDGYTIDFATTNHTVTPSEHKLNYDPIKSFAPVVLMGSHPDVLLVNPSLPANSVKDLVALAKTKPGQLNYGSTGPGGGPYMEMEILKQRAKINIVNVTYKGVAPALVATLAGEVPMTFGAVDASFEQVKAGKLRALAVTSNVRVPVLPDVPTLAEAADLPGFNEGTWYGVIAPAGTPADIVHKMNRDIAEIIKSPDVQKQLFSQGFVTVADTPEEFGQFLRQDMAKWAALLKSLGNP